MTRVLLIDDDDLVLQTLAIGLRSAGFTVITASDGGAGLRLLEDQSVDVLVTDMVMPEREGIELITHLRRDGFTAPIIAITGAPITGPMLGHDNSELYLKAARILGATRTLPKPFTPAQLVNEINDCLNAVAGVRTQRISVATSLF